MGRPKKDAIGIPAKERMIDAFWEMLAEMPYADITVRSISSKAEVNHNTFYRHFGNIDDMAQAAIDGTLLTGIPAALFSGRQAEFRSGEALEGILANTGGNFGKALLLARSGSAYLTKVLRTSLRDAWLKEAKLRASDLSDEERIDLSIIFGGIVAALGETTFPSDFPAISTLTERPIGKGIFDTLVSLGLKGQK